ncbi:unnamed protein product [Cuscuta europaea]|uniref:WRKY domain-containing protein n=1 Tax=Cuscuta europaea TaxID=41803 RepID=A0A9P1EJE6_CUSEU|nr:unnamed protein product [Cuscuta europaea]
MKERKKEREMRSASEATLDQILFHEDQDHMASQQLQFLCGVSSSCNNNNTTTPPFETLKTLTTPSLAPLPSLHEFSSTHNNNHHQRDGMFSLFGAPQLLSLQRSTPYLWEWEETNECIMRSSKKLGVTSLATKMKKSTRKKVREPRFSFKTMSDMDVLDDGYKWRKYGQKVVKNTHHPRSYYRCTQYNCRVKKRVERLAEDPRMVITTYEGRHVHSPSQDDEDDLHSSSQHSHIFC